LELSEEEKQYEKMTKQSIPTLVNSLAFPTVISMLITSVYNMADTYFVSQLGTSASAAVGIVFALMSVIQAFGFSLGMGSGSFISRFLGKKDIISAEKYASSALAAATVVGLLIMIFGLLFLSPFMKLLGSTQTILPYSCQYAKYILIGAPIMCASFVLNNRRFSQHST
jgi:Na+-driven multidrug efflux pump